MVTTNRATSSGEGRRSIIHIADLPLNISGLNFGLQTLEGCSANNGGFNGVMSAYGPQLNSIITPHFCKIWSSLGLSTLITNYAVEKVGRTRSLYFTLQYLGGG